MELKSVLTSVDVPLRPASPFTTTGRPATPKRQKKSFRGQHRYALMPIDQSAWNVAINAGLKNAGWTCQPVANHASEMVGANLVGDFVKNRVFVEVEFGNVASVYRDLFKFQIASRANTCDVAVLVAATSRLARLFDQGVASFEYLLTLREYLSIGLQMPVWIVGLDASNWTDIHQRYDEMYAVATANGIECHPFEVAASADSDDEPDNEP